LAKESATTNISDAAYDAPTTAGKTAESRNQSVATRTMIPALELIDILFVIAVALVWCMSEVGMSEVCRRYVGGLMAFVGGLSGFVGVCRRLSAFVGVCRRLSAFVGVCWSLPACRTMSDLVGPCRDVS
jgi:hypothetical protein